MQSGMMQMVCHQKQFLLIIITTRCLQFLLNDEMLTDAGSTRYVGSGQHLHHGLHKKAASGL